MIDQYRITKSNKISSIGAILGKDNIDIQVMDSDKNPETTAVFVFFQKTNKLLHTTVSSDGKVTLKNISLEKGPFFIIAHHPTRKFNGVIADNIGGENVDN